MIELTIRGMTCDGCVRSVQRALSGVPAVRSVEVDRNAGLARVDMDVSDAPALVAAVKAAGYDAGLVE